MLRPFRWKVLEYCATANYTSGSYWNASVCSSTIDFHKTRGKKGQIGGAAFIISAFSVQNLQFSPSPPPSTFSEQPTRAKTIQRHRHIGSIKWLCSLEPLRWRRLAVRPHSTAELLQQLLSYPCWTRKFCSGWWSGCGPTCFSRPPRSLARSPPPWGVSLSGHRMTRR